MSLLRVLAASLLAAAAPASAAVPGWVPAEPAGTLDEANPGSVATLRFQDRLQNRGFHQICDKIPLHVEVNVNQALQSSERDGDAGFLAGGQGAAGRRFYRGPTGALAMVDEANVDVSVGYAQTLLDIAAASPLSLIVSARAQGQTLVARPLKRESSCGELGELLKLSAFKSGIPATASRIGAMEVGELWKLPVSFTIGVGPQAGLYASNDALRGSAAVSLSYTRAGGAMVTLLRTGPKELRFRLRMDRLSAVSGSGGIVGDPLPLVQLGAPAVARLLARVLRRSWADKLADSISGAIANYLQALVSYGERSSDSQEVMLEYVLDPTDAAQMAGLERAIKGDLLTSLQAFKSLGLGGERWADDARDFLRGVEEVDDAAIGRDPRFAGALARHAHASDLPLGVPALFDFDLSHGRTQDRVVESDPSKGEIRSATGTRDQANAWFPLPIVGTYKRTERQRSVQAASVVKPAGDSGPTLIYIQQDGFLRGSRSREREEGEKIDRLLGNLGGAGKAMGVPLAAVPNGSFSGATSLTLVLLPKAVEDVLKAAPAAIVAAYEATLEGLDADAMDALRQRGAVRPDGRVSVPASLRQQGGALAAAAADVARTAAGLLSDVRKAAAAKTPDQRAEALERLVSGRGDSGLAYEDVMAVLLRLVDPADVGGEFLEIANAAKGGDSVIRRFVLNAPALTDPIVQRISRANRRFMPPLPITD